MNVYLSEIPLCWQIRAAEGVDAYLASPIHVEKGVSQAGSAFLWQGPGIPAISCPIEDFSYPTDALRIALSRSWRPQPSSPSDIELLARFWRRGVFGIVVCELRLIAVLMV